ncbi:response regulator transcription factor [Paracoccus binzhouensis]|uniref:response regulator transcription factor n=1 Tax=Paracoccus binzhouensis TaxID=2796149 RepID=UPI0018EF2333|nr:response regulator [Paracoccus binzhouensis]
MSDVTLTIFVIDDDDDIRRSLARALERRGYAVESHASAQSFLEGYDPRRPGCLILDYGMPGMNGLELQKHMNAMGMAIPIIFITGHGGVPESVQAIKAGAVDFLEKPFRQTDLLERIETAFVIARARLADEEQSRNHRARFERLTAREMEIVERMVARPSEISSKEIAAALGISPRTVDHHRARILEKLNARSVAELIALAGK